MNTTVEQTDTEATPQLQVDLCALEYRKAQMSRDQWLMLMATYWAGWIGHTLDSGRN